MKNRLAIIRNALIHFLTADPGLLYVNVVYDEQNIPVFPEEVLQTFDDLVEKATGGTNRED